MMFSKLRLINKSQKGLTLLELMLAMAITTIIIGGITMTIAQVIIGGTRTNNHMIAVRQVQDAGYWVSHDTVMAQGGPVIVNDGGGQLVSLTLSWSDWGSGEVYQVVYTLVDMPSGSLKDLQRSHSVNGTTNTSIIAQFIDSDPAKTSCDFTDGKLTFIVTATVGASSQQESETRRYEVVPRPGS